MKAAVTRATGFIGRYISMVTRTALLAFCLCMSISCTVVQESRNDRQWSFNPAKDILSLHYDHAPDRDDGHSAAADRTILQSIYGKNWIADHVIAVSGAYGKNGKDFNKNSDAVMDAAWNDCGGWLPAHTSREAVISELTKRWSRTLEAGGDVWIKEGGQSDLTAAVVAGIIKQMPDVDTTARIHTVQHSDWNENQTTASALRYIRRNTHYVLIKDANAYLNVAGGDDAFVVAATEHLEFGRAWKAAFAYYNPKERLDFSDTGELMYILELGEMGFDEFRERYLKKSLKL